MMPTLAFVTGSRALKGRTDARGWLTDRIADLQPSLVVSGTADGPDQWAASVGGPRIRAHTGRFYALDGTVQTRDRSVIEQWTDAPTSPHGAPHWQWKDRCLERDRVMAAWVIAQSNAYDVVTLALIAAWSKTQGTAYTVSLMRAANLSVVTETWQWESP
jgi:hypothetical protein